MKTTLIRGLTLLSTLSLAGCSAEDDVPTRVQFATCDDDRPTTFFSARDLYGVTQAVADGNEGFLLYGSNTSNKPVVRVDHAGNFIELLEDPEKDRMIQDVSPTADGGAILSSVDWSFKPLPPLLRQALAFKMDATWSAAWQVEIGPPGVGRTMVRALPDGGAIVAGIYDQTTTGALRDAEASELPTTTEPSHGVFSARLSKEGELLWQRLAPFEASAVHNPSWWTEQTLAIGPGDRLRLATGTADGVLLISSDLNGESEQQLILDTRLALVPVGVAALPDGRLAILSNRDGAVVTMIDAEGDVLWEKSYGREHGAEAFGIAANGARREILVSGSTRGQGLTSQRTWLTATDFDGEPTWSLERRPMDLVGPDGNVEKVTNAQGPAVLGLAVAPDGTVLGAGYTGFQLTYFALGTEACHE